ncbi:hypothetical protein KR222_011201 [Zaprionus bogoriensis]|nr:hypothetical protein KR222_011201 [Zaprionus bogoriensis]
MEAKKKDDQGTNTLRRPNAVVKKRSGPLDDMLNELNLNEKTLDLQPTKLSLNQSSAILPSEIDGDGRTSIKLSKKHSQSVSMRRRYQIKDKEKKRERWLLTRKTWRYMTDAGRKLLPEGIQHSSADSIGYIETNFQQVCAMEPRFVVWRRKASFPGATKYSKRRLKILSRHSNKLQLLREQDEQKNINEVIELLQRYLNIRNAYKTTTLLGTKTIRPDQTTSPSSQRPEDQSTRESSYSYADPADCERQLFDTLKLLGGIFTCVGLDMHTITPEILKDKALLKKIYNILKKQQLHRLLHTIEPNNPQCLGHAVSFSSLINYNDLQEKAPKELNSVRNLEIDTSLIKRMNDNIEKTSPLCYDRRRKPPESLHLHRSSKITQVNSCGTQTNFIQLNELKLLAENYELTVEHNSEGEVMEANNSGLGMVSSLEIRKSSIDNEDVSQSVSDTIKRYLRMARKKSSQDAYANRFKSVNYDRNLKNIKAKGEINPPGIDEDNNKAVQTLNAWAVIALDYIRGNEASQHLKLAHIAWQKELDERTLRKLEYDQNCRARDNKNSISGKIPCKSAPTSPTSAFQQQHHLREKTGGAASGLLSSSSHFLSNFWHVNSVESSTCHSLKHRNINVNYLNSKNETTNMQKSKSLSNIGQFVSRKIWGNRLKGQIRQDDRRDIALYADKWAPSENCIWISEQGQFLKLTDTSLEKLSDIEAESLMYIALEKLKELNIGVNIERKPQKSQLLLKKRALTTSFFDIGKKDENSGRDSLFGMSLENCLLRDKKQENTRSKQSITSVFRSSDNSSKCKVGKLNGNVRSCESLPTKSMDSEGVSMADYSFKTLAKSIPITMQISRSQFDMRSGSEINLDRIEYQESKNPFKHCLSVPTFVVNCIEYLEVHGLKKIGIFRVSTSKRRVKLLREDFNKNWNMCVPDNTCPHDIATLLKEYLRDLPEPLLCEGLYTSFLETQRIRNRRLQLEAISHLIKLLPVTHRDTLYVLLKFLGNVAAHCDDVYSRDGALQMSGNKMDSNNISTVFAPNILRDSTPRVLEYNEQGNLTDTINVIRIMIDHYEELFKVPSEMINVLYTYMLDTCPEKLHSLISSKNIEYSK